MASVSLSVPHHEQEQEASSLVACVRMALAFLGQIRTEAELRALLGTDEYGTKPRDLPRLSALGIDVQMGGSTLEQLEAILGAGSPPLLFVHTSHLPYWEPEKACYHVVVAVGIDDVDVALNDPYFLDAPRKVPRTALDDAWSVTDRFCAILGPRPTP